MLLQSLHYELAWYHKRVLGCLIPYTSCIDAIQMPEISIMYYVEKLQPTLNLSGAVTVFHRKISLFIFSFLFHRVQQYLYISSDMHIV